MSFYSFRLIRSSFLQHPGLPFAEVLPEESIQQAFDDAGVHRQPKDSQADNIVYTAAVTLWEFLSQVFHKEELRSCLAATSRVVVLMATLGRDCSDNTGAYCRARAKLPLAVIQRLTLQVADGCETRVPKHWLWKGRHVKLVDGTTTSAPDTPDNQAAFPQPNTQKPGLGFPIIRMGVLLSIRAIRVIRGSFLALRVLARPAVAPGIRWYAVGQQKHLHHDAGSKYLHRRAGRGFDFRSCFANFDASDLFDLLAQPVTGTGKELTVKLLHLSNACRTVGQSLFRRGQDAMQCGYRHVLT